jgi:hypothetical protein
VPPLPLLLRTQGAYYIATGLWPIIHFRSFEAVTGPKVDDWLVHMVGLLAATIGSTLMLAVRQKGPAPEAVVLAVGSAMSFAVIDLWYSARGTISPVYAADAAVEVTLVILLLLAVRRTRGS